MVQQMLRHMNVLKTIQYVSVNSSLTQIRPPEYQESYPSTVMMLETVMELLSLWTGCLATRGLSTSNLSANIFVGKYYMDMRRNVLQILIRNSFGNEYYDGVL